MRRKSDNNVMFTSVSNIKIISNLTNKFTEIESQLTALKMSSNVDYRVSMKSEFNQWKKDFLLFMSRSSIAILDKQEKDFSRSIYFLIDISLVTILKAKFFFGLLFSDISIWVRTNDFKWIIVRSTESAVLQTNESTTKTNGDKSNNQWKSSLQKSIFNWRKFIKKKRNFPSSKVGQFEPTVRIRFSMPLFEWMQYCGTEQYLETCHLSVTLLYSIHPLSDR